MKYRVVNLAFSVYVPENLSEEDTIEYLNEKLYTDPEFFGEIDFGTIQMTNMIEEY